MSGMPTGSSSISTGGASGRSARVGAVDVVSGATAAGGSACGVAFVRVTAAAVIVTEVSATADRTDVITARLMALPVRTGSLRCRAVI